MTTKKRAEICIEKNQNDKWVVSGTLYPNDDKYADSIYCEGTGAEYDSAESAKDVAIKFCKDRYGISADAISFI